MFKVTGKFVFMALKIYMNCGFPVRSLYNILYKVFGTRCTDSFPWLKQEVADYRLWYVHIFADNTFFG